MKLGAVLEYFPALHVDHAEQVTYDALFCPWYVDSVQAVQLVDIVSKANPAGQKLQLDPGYDSIFWYFPLTQLLHAWALNVVGAVDVVT